MLLEIRLPGKLDILNFSCDFVRFIFFIRIDHSQAVAFTEATLRIAISVGLPSKSINTFWLLRIILSALSEPYLNAVSVARG
jgi:hypothetical protein